MGDCDRCDGDESMAYTCNECGGTFCSDHRLPEAHRCETLLSKESDAWFKDELSVRENRQSERVRRNSKAECEAEENGSTAAPTCVGCGRSTERECEDCGTTYCKRHVSPRVHNCAFLDGDVDSSWNPHSEQRADTHSKPDLDGRDDEGGSGLLQSLLSSLDVFR